MAQRPSEMETSGYALEHGDRFLRVRFFPGTTITREMILSVLQQEFMLPRSAVVNDLWDLRGCFPDARLKAPAVIQIVNFIKLRFHPSLSHKKTALIVDSASGYGMTRMFQILADDLPYAVNIFTNDADALDWLTADHAAGEQTRSESSDPSEMRNP